MVAASLGTVLLASTQMTSVSPTATALTRGAAPSSLRTESRTGPILSTSISVCTDRAGSLAAPVAGSNSDSLDLGWSRSAAWAWYILGWSSDRRQDQRFDGNDHGDDDRQPPNQDPQVVTKLELPRVLLRHSH